MIYRLHVEPTKTARENKDAEEEEEERGERGGEMGEEDSKPPRRDFPAFPFEPYPIQTDFMSSLYDFLDKGGGIAMLESPTGTPFNSLLSPSPSVSVSTSRPVMDSFPDDPSLIWDQGLVKP